jgi:hypothetical protein
LPDLGQPAFSADKHLGHCRDQAEIIPRLIDATAQRQFRASTLRASECVTGNARPVRFENARPSLVGRWIDVLRSLQRKVPQARRFLGR